jgi:hypothetical protein
MNRKSWLLLLLGLALIGGTAGFLSYQQAHQKLGVPGVKVVANPMFDTEGRLVGSNSVFLPESVLNFRSEGQPVSLVTLGWLPKDTTYGQRLYTAPDGFSAALTVVLMGTDRTSIHKPQYCLTGIGWSIDQTELTSIPISEPHPYELPVTKLTASHEWPTPDGGKARQNGVYVYWFVADHELTAQHGQRMWWMARDMLRDGVLQRWAYVSCFSTCAPGQEETTYNRMKDLISASVPQFQLATGAPAPLARSL